MAFAEIIEGVIVTINRTGVADAGQVAVPDSVMPGDLDNGDGTFTRPEPPAQSLRAQARSALWQQWQELPPWIRGPYKADFEAANALLDDGDDDAAVWLIGAVEPTAAITSNVASDTLPEGVTMLDLFNQVRGQFAAALGNLPQE